MVGGVHLWWGAREGPENNLTEKKEEKETVNMKPWTFQEMIS